MSTAILTSAFGFLFWMFAARMATTEVVGRAAALISAMQLIATICVFGIPTYLIGHLRRHEGAAMRRLVVTCLGVAGALATLVAALYAIAHHMITNDHEWMY